jgi:hypothetical protein
MQGFSTGAEIAASLETFARVVRGLDQKGMMPMRRPSPPPIPMDIRVINWITHFCIDNGKYVHLTPAEIKLIELAYHDDAVHDIGHAISGRLAVYLTLFHLCGPMYDGSDPPPLVKPDVFSLWAATGPRLREVLRLQGETIVCDELGRSWKAA